jgi:hypothetical protein
MQALQPFIQATLGEEGEARRTMLLGQMTASTWTRVVDEVKEGHNLREPVPPRHSPGTSSVPSFTVKWNFYGFYVTGEKKGF